MLAASNALRDESARPRARLRVFAVFGNHDCRGRCADRIVQAYAARGVQCLRNQGLRFGVGWAGLALCGIEDLEQARAVRLGRALQRESACTEV